MDGEDWAQGWPCNKRCKKEGGTGEWKAGGKAEEDEHW
jgi:hypothetical protein